MPHVDILLATYNGESYVAQQIRSLQNQTFADWQLIVHDDGSTDRTVAIVRRLAAADARIRLVDDGVCGLGSARHFLHLMKFSQAPFAICCDQDDLWLERKLERTLALIEQQDNRLPQAVVSNGFIYTEGPEGPFIGGSAMAATPQRLEDLFFLNGGVLGCTILFNAALRRLCLDAPPLVRMHDQLLMTAALTFGQVHYVRERLMLYRRHASAVTDARAGSLTERARSFAGARHPVLRRHDYEALRSFYRHFSDRIPAARRVSFLRFFDFEHHSRAVNALRAWFYGFSLYNRRSFLCFKLLVRPLLAPSEGEGLF